jgi:hypothetical protein
MATYPPMDYQRDALLTALSNGLLMENATPLVGGFLDQVSQMEAEQQARADERQAMVSGLTDMLTQGAIEGTLTDDRAARYLQAQLMALGKANKPMSNKMDRILDQLYPTLENDSLYLQRPAPTGGNFSPLYSGENLLLDGEDMVELGKLTLEGYNNGVAPKATALKVLETLQVSTVPTVIDDMGNEVPNPDYRPDVIAQVNATVNDFYSYYNNSLGPTASQAAAQPSAVPTDYMSQALANRSATTGPAPSYYMNPSSVMPSGPGMFGTPPDESLLGMRGLYSTPR